MSGRGRGGGRGGGGRGRGGGGGGRGRGAYYKAKYGGGGRGRGGGGTGDGAASGGLAEAKPSTPRGPAKPHTQLLDLLQRIDGKPYPAYKDMYGQWSFDTFTLSVDHVQGDAYAAPSRFHLDVPTAVSRFPAQALQCRIRRIALADYLNRRFAVKVHELGIDEAKAGGGWSGQKGGDLRIAVPSQHVCQRSAVTVQVDGSVQVRFTIALPARGRSISGGMLQHVLTSCLPDIVNASCVFAQLDAADVQRHICSVEDQEHLRGLLQGAGLVAFVRNGAVLPRASGANDKPMGGKDVIPFVSPLALEVEFSLPNLGVIRGMGVKQGVSLVVGGGFHGKSTLLKALEVGVYNHIPGDGREGVVTDPTAVKVRAEDGRAIHCVDISAFISNLPMRKDTSAFSTADASGSTSQAAGISEALEAGSKALLIDEDTAATNFMIRDARMQLLVAPEQEPITPFIARVRQLWEQHGVSSILVIGGAGDYFAVADHVLQMDAYVCKDVTARAKEIASMQLGPSSAGGGVVPPPLPAAAAGGCSDTRAMYALPKTRAPRMASLASDGKVQTRSMATVQFGGGELDLGGVEPLVEVGQTRAIVDILQWAGSQLSNGKGLPGGSRASPISLPELLDWLDGALDETLDAVKQGWFEGNHTRPRRFEIAAAMGRLRQATFTQS
mgnify:CR=1 FL=1